MQAQAAGITENSLQRLRSLGTNPLLETQIGRLLYLDRITRTEYETAVRIAEIYRRFDESAGCRRWPASPSSEIGNGRSLTHEDEATRERASAATRDFGMLQCEMRLCPRGTRTAIEELCVDDRACPPGWLPNIKLALQMLAPALGMRTRRKKA